MRGSNVSFCAIRNNRAREVFSFVALCEGRGYDVGESYPESYREHDGNSFAIFRPESAASLGRFPRPRITAALCRVECRECQAVPDEIKNYCRVMLVVGMHRYFTWLPQQN